MILGKIIGKVKTTSFSFVADSEPSKFEYVQVYHKQYGYVLAQIVELIRDSDKLLAKCAVIGFKDDRGNVRGILEPFFVGSEVLYADDDFVKEIISLDDKSKGGFVGKLQGRDIDVYLNLQKLLTKHLAVLAKSGAGKSYFVGCLLEEIMTKKVPLLVIDAHGEYSTMRFKNDSDGDLTKMPLFGIKPKAFKKNIVEYGDVEFNSSAKPLKLSENLTPGEIMSILPSKLTSAQENLLFSVMRDLDFVNFDDLILALEEQDSPIKYNVINLIDTLRKMEIFSHNPVDFNELIQSGRCSILNFRGFPPFVQEVVVFKLLKDLFHARKKNEVPPFFAIIEEAHNFCPERSFGQTKCSEIIRNIASEGRKFGLGLGVISQRPARVDKSVLSQVTTQAILKVTNPNDLKAIINSVEGISGDSEEQIKSLSIGSAMITGVVDMPLFAKIRPRMSKHGGESIDILGHKTIEGEDDFFEKLEEFKGDEKEILPLIMPKITKKDLVLMNENPVERVDLELVPAVICFCREGKKEYNILIERITSRVVRDLDQYKLGSLPKLSELNKMELKVLEQSFYKKKFSVEEFLSKHGGNLDVKRVLDSLVAKNYLTSVDEIYSLNPEIILANLSTCQIFEKIEFKREDYSKKLDPLISLDRIKKLVGTFVEIVDLRDCYIGKYVVVEKK